MKRLLVGILCGMLAIGTFAGCGGMKDDNKQEEQSTTNELDLSAEDAGYDTIDWEKDEPYCHVPDPNTNKITIMSEDEYSVEVIIHGVSKTGFKKYVDLCKNMGYTKDSYYSQGEGFYGENADGYEIQLYYLTKEEYSSESEWTDNMDKSIGMIIYIPDSDTEESSEEEATLQSDTNTTNTDVSSSEVRPEIKEFLDSYEAFMKEYCNFMKQYNNTDDVTPLLDQYTEIMKKYTDFTKKYDNLSSEYEMNDAEYDYYFDVQDRVNDMLIDAM